VAQEDSIQKQRMGSTIIEALHHVPEKTLFVIRSPSRKSEFEHKEITMKIVYIEVAVI
jgi:hypothetical protein